MAKALFEHVNFTVNDPDATAGMLGRLFGWKVRWAGDAIHGGRTVHVGTDDQYVALYRPAPEKPTESPSMDGNYSLVGGINHLGILVDDLDAAETRVKAEGLTPHSHQEYEPGRRFYFHDRDGVEYEVVSYA